MGFLSPAAPAPFSGILFEFVTFSVLRLLPPADRPGGSTGVVAWGQHSAEMWSAPQC